MKVKSPSTIFISSVRLMAPAGDSSQAKPVAKAIALEGDIGRGYHCNRPQRNWVLGRVAKQLQIFALMILALFLGQFRLIAQNAPQTGRPLLFLHGWCGSPDDWDTLAEEAAGATPQQPLYPNQTLHLVYFDGTSVKLWPSGLDFFVLQPTERFFSIVFFDDQSYSDFSSPDTIQIAGISVLNKADEVAQVIRAITTLTHVKDVTVVAHSMGGLVTRAYMQGMAVPYNNAICSDSNGYACVGATRTPFGNNIHKVITLDTPHSGAQIASNTALLAELLTFPGSPFASCAVEPTLNRRELEPTSGLVYGLMYDFNAPLPNDVPVTAIRSFYGFMPWGYLGDDIVSTQEQSIESVVPGNSLYVDRDNHTGGAIPYTACSPPILHGLSCLGAQQSTAPILEDELADSYVGSYTSIQVRATLDGSAWSGPLHYSISGTTTFGASVTLTDSGCSSPCIFGSTPAPTYYNIPTGMYTINTVSGGPSAQYTIAPEATQTLAVIPSTGENNWNLTFTVAFRSAGDTLTVNSSNPSSGVGIAVIPADNNASGNGTTSFSRTYNQASQVTLTAPATAGGNSFSFWTGCDQPSGLTCKVTMTSAKAVTANYGTSTTPTAHFTMSGQGNIVNDGGTLTLSVASSNTAPVTFTSTGTKGSASISSYVWKSNGGQICPGSGSTCTQSFGPGSGQFTAAIALVVTDSNAQSSTATGIVVVNTQNASTTATPTFSLASGTYTGTQTVSISDATPGATIYYTHDGTTPTTSSTVYSNPLSVPSGTSVTFKAIAVASGYATSAVATASYTINYPLPSVTGAQVIPSPVNSGNSTTVTINLSGPAPSGGAVVSLSSTNTSAFPLPST